MIRLGDSGPEVTAWQHKLRDHGFDWLPVTGRHEGLSVSLTRAFQHGAGIEVDGVVGPDSEREMERQLNLRHGYREAVMLEQQWNAFFDSVRGSFGRLNQSQVDGLMFLVKRGLNDGLSTSQLAYVLATVWHETAKTMRPIEEFGRGRGHSYGRSDAETGQTYYGRGYVQLTHRENYARADSKLGTRMEWNASLALRPDIAAQVLFRGMMEGWFTTRKLPDYVNGQTDFRNARKVVNGLDRADLIAGHARKFQAAIDAARFRPGRPQPAPPRPAPLPPRPGESQLGQRVMPFVAGIIIIAVIAFVVWRIVS